MFRNYLTRVFVPFVLIGLLGIAQAQNLNTLEIDDFVADAMKQHGVPGVGLAIIKDGKIIYTKGYGVRDTKTGVSVDANTLFAIGSVSKSFTALGAMQLVDAGKLSLETKVNAVLPNLKFSDTKQGAAITLQNLLSHTSGMPRADDLWYFDSTVKTRADMLSTVEKIPFSTPVGTTWQYNNQNFVIAGAMLEKTTNSTWENYTQQNIFVPLGMKRSIFKNEDAIKDGNYAQGFQVGLSGLDVTPVFSRMEIAGPAGSIISSASDMAQYAAFQLSKGIFNGKRIVSQNALKVMHSNQIAIPNSLLTLPGLALPGYGLGWFNAEYRGAKFVQHSGNIDGFSATIHFVPAKRLGIVVLSNLNGANDFLDTINYGVTERVLGMTPRSQFQPNPLLEQLAAAQTFKPELIALKTLEGKYALVSGSNTTISFKDGQLSLGQEGQTFVMTAISPTSFMVNIQGALILLEFQIDPSGMIWLLQNGQIIGVRIAT